MGGTTIKYQNQNQHQPAGALDSDRQERQARPWATFRSAYRPLLGGDTPRLSPGDTQGAAEFLARIEEAQKRGGWTGAERTRLSRMHKRWAARASGHDARFMVMGNVPGRPDPWQARRIRDFRR